MRIANKVATGYTILILLIVAVFSYQLAVIYQMQSITRDLGGQNLKAAELSLQLFRDFDQTTRFTQILDVKGGDRDYAEQIEQLREGLSKQVEQIQALKLSTAEQRETNQLAFLWNQDQEVWKRQRGVVGSGTRQGAIALADQRAAFEELMNQSQAVTRASRLAIAAQVENSEQAALQVEWISFITALLALLVSIGVSIWIVRSISGPLHRLTEGTHAVSHGEFTYRLDAQGSDELGELARDFNSMTQRLTELDQMKKDFVSHASHELKTPLASMQETIRLLLDEIPGKLAPQQRQLLELNLQSGRRLSRLIANLLDLSRMEAGVMEYDLESQDLAAVVRSAIAEFELPLAERRLTLEVALPENPAWVQCDGSRVIQVLHNLLGNAQKFSPAGSTIRLTLRQESNLPATIPGSYALRLSADHNRAGFVLITIADQGPGVPAGEKAKIFEKFHQVRRDGKRASQGTGLGLAISRTIVESHNGALWVEDNPGGGSIFCVLLPSEGSIQKGAPRASAPI